MLFSCPLAGAPCPPPRSDPGHLKPPWPYQAWAAGAPVSATATAATATNIVAIVVVFIFYLAIFLWCSSMWARARFNTRTASSWVV